MSYDLLVYGCEVDLSILRNALETADLIVDDYDAESWTVLRGKRRRYSFTVERPVRVESEDVPEEVTAAVLGPTRLVEVLVEGSAESEIPHAIRAARRIAAAIDGAVLDPQTGTVFRGGRSRSAEPVERGYVSVVEVHWYVRAQDGDRISAARAFVAAAKRHLPEALPRRYGSFEPLQKRWDDGGAEAFVAFIEAEDDTVYIQGTAPIPNASIGRARQGDSDVDAHSLSMLAAPLEDERWRLSLERMFVEFAQAVDAVYASAEVVRGIEWSGRALWFGSEAEDAIYLAGQGNWHGLPPYPVWLSWFGREYAPIVREHLSVDSTTEIGDSLLHRQSDGPADRDELLARMAKPPVSPTKRQRPWFGLRRKVIPTAAPPPWLPLEYLAVPRDHDPAVFGPPGMAPNIPPSLIN